MPIWLRWKKRVCARTLTHLQTFLPGSSKSVSRASRCRKCRTVRMQEMKTKLHCGKKADVTTFRTFVRPSLWPRETRHLDEARGGPQSDREGCEKTCRQPWCSGSHSDYR